MRVFMLRFLNENILYTTPISTLFADQANLTLYPLLHFLGIHFEMKEDDVLKDFLLLGMRVIFHGVDATLHNSNNQNISNSPLVKNSSNNFVQERWKKTDCSKDRWSQSNNFFNHLLKTELPGRKKVYFLCFSLFNWIDCDCWVQIFCKFCDIMKVR